MRVLSGFDGSRRFFCPDDDGVEDVNDISCDRMMVLPADDFTFSNGNFAHFVEDFVGERFSIIYFTPSTWESADAVASEFLVECDWKSE